MKEYLEAKFKNKKILILGFAREGQSTFKFLRQFLPEVEIAVADQKVVHFEVGAGVRTIFGDEYLKSLGEYDIVIKSPGISGLKTEIIKAQSNGVEITSQTKIFFDIVKGSVIGVTGTKGKSTTSSLIYEMLKKGGKEVSLVGNIGSPVLDSLEGDSPGKYYVFELSSHQLFDLEKSPHIAVVTNVAVDHLDWYGNFENYVDAKTHILKYQTHEDIAILNYDNLIARGFDRFSRGTVLFTSKVSVTKGAYVQNGSIYLGEDNKTEMLGNTSELKLIGKHNWDNVMLAALAAKNSGVNNEDIWSAASGFKQQEHHLEFVRDFQGIAFYDDSYAVDQIATSAAINSFDKDITLILGGFDRGIDYSEIAGEIAAKQNVKTIIVIGQIAGNLIKLIKKAGFRGKIVEPGRAKMDKTVLVALENTQAGSIILLSPAAASFDMFKDYKDRGIQFKKAVMSLN